MNESERRRSRAASRRRQPANTRRRHWPFSLLSLGSALLLLLCASRGYGTAPIPAHAQAAAARSSGVLAPVALAFLRQNCAACHNKGLASGGLNLAATAFKPTDAANFAHWVKLYDRVAAGEMPPKGAAQPTPAARKAFLAVLAQPLAAADGAKERSEGRAVWRRMNRYEYENTLRDLLDAPWLQINEMLPEDGLAYRLNKVGDALDVSHVQMSRYLAAADYALREAMAKSGHASRDYDEAVLHARPAILYWSGEIQRASTAPGTRDISAFSAIRRISRAARTGPAPTVGASDPARREHEAMGVVASAYEPLQPQFDEFRAPVAGQYKLRLCAHSFWAGPENPQTLVAAKPHGSLRRPHAGAVSLYAELPPQQLAETGQHRFRTAPHRRRDRTSICSKVRHSARRRAVLPFASARLAQSAGAKGRPAGRRVQWLEVEGPIYDAWPTQAQRLMFGDLPLKETASVESGRGCSQRSGRGCGAASARVYGAGLRRPLQDQDVQPFVKLYHTARDAGAGFTDAMIAAYSGVLCSPAFVTLEEKPGPLDDHALATRLSYFLWNSEPDLTLRALADRGALHKPAELAAQTDRLLADSRSERFVDAFLDYWLDLRKTDTTSPGRGALSGLLSGRLPRGVSEDETHAFFSELIRGDLASAQSGRRRTS